MKLLVTGSAGMLGRDVCIAARARGHDVHARPRIELDVADEADVTATIAALRPDGVINCAAWTDVDGAEADEPGATAVNGDGAGNVARAATAIGARMVHVSTDYVFDGSARRPYVESDPTNPIGAYGRSKLAGEQQVLAAGPAHVIARTAWLFGVGGRNFAATMLRLAREGAPEIAVVTDQVGCPTFTGHLAPALVTLAERGDGGIHHAAAAGRCSWNEFAREIFARAGLPARVVAATSAEMRRPAPRPAWSVLGTERPDAIALPPWQEGLDAYLEQISEASLR